MDDKLFKQKLSEVAEWKIPDTPRETSLNAKKKRGRKSAEEEYQELREEMFFEEFGGVNPTYAPMILKVKNAACTCEDCGKHCANGRHVETKLYDQNKNPQWRKRCTTCNRSYNPYTKKYDATTGQAGVLWTCWNRGQEIPPVLREILDDSNDAVTITKYPRD